MKDAKTRLTELIKEEVDKQVKANPELLERDHGKAAALIEGILDRQNRTNQTQQQPNTSLQTSTNNNQSQAEENSSDAENVFAETAAHLRSKHGDIRRQVESLFGDLAQDLLSRSNGTNT